MCEKCGKGIIYKPDGENELDLCLYQDVEKYKNVTVTISKCVYCGHIDISWERQEDTEKLEIDEED